MDLTGLSLLDGTGSDFGTATGAYRSLNGSGRVTIFFLLVFQPIQLRAVTGGDLMGFVLPCEGFFSSKVNEAVRRPHCWSSDPPRPGRNFVSGLPTYYRGYSHGKNQSSIWEIDRFDHIDGYAHV